MTHDDRGFTLVETLAVMAAAIVVLIATLGAFDAFSRGTSDSNRLTQLEDTSRLQLDRANATIRNASPGPGLSDAIRYPLGAGASGNDLIFTSYDWPFTGGTANQLHAIRYCVDSSGALWQQGLDNAASYTAGTPLTCGTNAGWVASKVIASNVANTTTDPLFALNTTRRTVAISLTLSDPQRATRAVALRSAAYVRAYNGAPSIGPGDISTTCDAASKTALLQLGTNVDASFTVTFRNASGTVVGTGTNVTVAAAAASSLTVSVKNALGQTQPDFSKPVPAC